jgi:hypothetical protein
MIYDLGDAEALRLMRAFQKIRDPEARRIIIGIVEAAAQVAAAIKDKEPETRPCRDLS